LELLVTRIQDSEEGVVKLALETLRKEIRTSTSSMTAVPKPLKFLHPHYDNLKAAHQAAKPGPHKVCSFQFALSLCLTTPPPELVGRHFVRPRYDT